VGRRKLINTVAAKALLGLATDEDSLIRHYTLDPADRLECEVRDGLTTSWGSPSNSALSGIEDVFWNKTSSLLRSLSTTWQTNSASTHKTTLFRHVGHKHVSSIAVS
jgi:hypothetical protein